MNAFWASSGRETFIAAQSAKETQDVRPAAVAVPTAREETMAALAKAAPTSLENFNVRDNTSTNDLWI